MRWLLDMLLGLLARWRGAADEARMEARVADARREAFQDRAQADEAARRADDALERLRRDWRRPGSALAAICVLGLGACDVPPPAIIRAVDTGCDWARPILVADGDQLTQETARAVLAHNETWQKRCGGAR